MDGSLYKVLNCQFRQRIASVVACLDFLQELEFLWPMKKRWVNLACCYRDSLRKQNFLFLVKSNLRKQS